MGERKYYEAYDDRYRQVHAENLQWASAEPSGIVEQVMARYGITGDKTILELGCGEGRDAVLLLNRGYRVTASDISSEAIAYCRRKYPKFAERFQLLDCVRGSLEETFDCIYAVAVIHMLVEDPDRAGFYSFIREHLTQNGIGLVCTMGDGTLEQMSDISTAFELRERTHAETGRTLQLAATSCRMVGFAHFIREITENGLTVVEHGITAVKPDFPVMMYAVVKRKLKTWDCFTQSHVDLKRFFRCASSVPEEPGGWRRSFP